VLTVSFKRKVKKPPVPYSGTLKIAGFFSVDPSVPKEKMETLLMVNGLSMLYSSAREHVLSVTSRGPWGPFYLPTVSFNPNADSIEGKTRKTSKK
jgi:preprotein translocase subunit SecB